MMKKQMNNILLVLALLCCALQSGAASFSGKGTVTNPYLIQSLADLKAFAEAVYDGSDYEGKYFKQTVDIVVNENVIKSDGTFNEADKAKFTNWKPAGHIWSIFSEKSFKGNYDGGNHSISGLYFGEDLDEPYVGLFGNVKKAIIQNVTIKDSYMGCKAAGSYNDNYHGFLVGMADNTNILNCHVSNSVMNVIANREVTCGGLVGRLESYAVTCMIKNCSFSGKIDVLSQSDEVYVGGLVGWFNSRLAAYTADVEGCSVDGTLNLRVDFSKSCDNCYLSGLLGGYDVDMENCVNRMNFNVSSVNFPRSFQYEGHHPEDVDYRSKYKHMKKLRIYPMCVGADNMVNCANFGDISIGTSNKLGPVDDIIVAPVGSIYKSMKSCAFYGLTKVGDNGYIYNSNPQADWGYWHNLFTLKTYAVAPNLGSSATFKYVLRREDGSSYSAKDGSINTESQKAYYLQDKDNVPSGVTLYKTTGLAEIINDAQTIVNEFTAYDEANKKTYKWGLLTDDETFMGCPVPTVLGGQETGLVGDGTEANPYLIQDVKDYKFAVAYSNSTNTSDKMYKLLADIDMSNAGQIDAIGTTDHPFAGIFDGNGHAIIGLNAKSGSMFGQVKNGNVRDLTLLDMTCNGVDNCYPLVNTLTSETTIGSISNCYVGGNINVNLTHEESDQFKECCVAGLCGTCKGGIIQDSYFKGNFNVGIDGGECYFDLKVAGLCDAIVANGNVKSYIENNYSIFNVNVNGISEEYLLEKVYGIVCADSKLGDDVLQTFEKNYFMTDNEVANNLNGTQVASYADLKMGISSSFINGVYNPVLPNTKSYKLADGRGLDAILVDGEGTGDNANVILHYVPSTGEDYQSDRYLWQHPNLAVYNADDDAEYLINCTLDNAKDLQLNMDKAKSQTIKANMHYPVSIYSDWDNKPLLQMLCLPVTVQRDALPEGSKLKIVGTKSFDTANNYFISTMVECDSVPAGVPFLLEIPAEATSADKKATYDLVLRGKVAAEPVSKIKVGDLSMETELKGTYVSYKKPNQFTYRDECEAEDGYYDVYKYENTVSPFHAYAVVEGETSSYNYQYRLVDNLLLDEQSNNVASMLDTYNGKTISVILKRSMKKDVWNTVCLPFDMSAAEIAKAFGTGTIVEELARVENTDGATIVFATTSDMKAGKTYLVKPAQNGSLYNLADRTITNELASEPEDATYDTYFKGTYAPILLEGTAPQTSDGYSYNYFIQSNKLYYLPEGQAVAMKGFRGWILIASNSLFGTDGNATNAKLMHCDGSTTDVRAIEYGTTANGTRIYNLQGIEHQEMQKGVNIIGGKKIMK